MIPSSAPLLRTVLRVIASTLFVLISGVAAAQEDPAAAGEAATPPSDAAAAPAPADASAAPTDAAAAPAESAPVSAETTPNAYENTVPVQEQAAQAQPAAAGSSDATKLEKVEVTGSRLKRQDFETAQPVAVVSRKDIERSGLTNIGDLLIRMTTAGSSINTAFASLALTGGETNLDFRNLGTNRVLILVDGHRWVNGLTSTSTSAVDLNTIPTSIIERIEVLKDGASAVYGSDAIAGVVNIITRKNYQGFELSSQYGEYEQGDGATQQHQISLGHVSGGTSLFANFSFTKEDDVKATSRWISKENHIGTGVGRWSSLGPEGRFTFVPYPQSAILPACQDTLPVCDLAHTPGTAGTFPTDFHHRGPEDQFNRAEGFNIKNPSKRYGLFTQLRQHLFDGVSFNFQGLYNHRSALSQIGYNIIQGGDLIGFPSYIDARQQYNPFHQDIGRGTPPADTTVNLPFPPTTIPDPTGIVGDTVVGGPTGAGLGAGSGVFGIRLLNDPRQSVFNNDTIRLGGGFEGQFDVVEHMFNWDIGYTYSKNSKKESGKSQNVFREDRLERALGPPEGCTGDCVPLNLFAGQAGITQAMIDYVAPAAVNRTQVRQDDVYLNITTDLGPVHLPAGPIAIALGGEYRRDQYHDMPDAQFQNDQAFGNNAKETRGQNSAREAYLELGIPVLGDLPLIKLIDLSLAGRVSKYALSGNATTGKAGMRWRVYDDLLLRGTYSSAFRAPSVGELFLGDTVSFDSVIDPCNAFRTDPTTDANCNADGITAPPAQQPQTRAIVGGNRDLHPEKARTLTYGLVFSPGLIRGLNINADYYRIKVDNFIATPGSQYILNACYRSANRAFCEFVHRTNSGTGPLDFIEDRYVNFSSLDTSGIDGGIDYTLPVPAVFGRNKVAVDTSYLIKYESRIPVPGQGDVISPPTVGQEFGGTSVPRWRGNAVYELQRGGFQFSWTTRMVYQRTEGCVDGFPGQPSLADFGLCSDPKTNADGTDISENRLKTVFYHDVQTGYTFSPSNIEVVIGVNNLFNRSPPISVDPSFGGILWNYDPLAYDIPGRFGYIRVGKKF